MWTIKRINSMIVQVFIILFLFPNFAYSNLNFPPIIPGDWSLLNSHKAVEIISQLNSYTEKDIFKVISDIHSVRYKNILFYPGATLYEANIKTATHHGVLTFIKYDDHFTIIDGNSNKIHKLNNNFNFDNLNLQQAEMYIRFFTSAMQGDEGIFKIIDAVDDVEWMHSLSSSQRDEIKSKIVPFSIEKIDRKTWEVIATIRYSNAIFSSVIHLDVEGMVEMQDDMPLVFDLPIPIEKYEDSIRIIQSRLINQNNATTQSASNYNDVAAIVSEPIFDATSVENGLRAYTDSGIILRKEYQRQRLNEMRPLDDITQSACKKIRKTLQKCRQSYQEIRRIDNKTPDYEGIVRKALASTPALLKDQQERSINDTQMIDDLTWKVMWEIGKEIFKSYTLSVERNNYSKHYNTSRYIINDSMSSLVKRRYAGSKKCLADNTISISHVTPSFANTYIKDVIGFLNVSGQDLVACTLLIKLRGIHASSKHSGGDLHFHYVNYWPAGEYRYVWYPSRALRGIGTNQSIDVIRNVEVNFFSDQLCTNATCNIDSNLYDAWVKEWADENLKPGCFTGRWYTKDENFIDPAGFEVKYEGDINRFAVQRVTVEAIQGNRSVRIYDDEAEWSSSQKKWICHQDFNSIDPSKLNVIITFPGSSYEHILHWTW